MATGKLPEKVIDLFRRLDSEGIEWVMVGAEAVNLYLARPRATVDVDIVVRQKHLRKVKKLLKDLCKDLKETEVHFKALLSEDPNRLELDVIKSQSHALFEVALDDLERINDVAVPRIEALLALKYLSAVSPWRSREDRGQDIVDFIRAFKHNRPRIDRSRLIDLASRAHRNAPKEFPEFLHSVENDQPITL